MRTKADKSEYNKQYRLTHREYFMAKNKEYHTTNKENISERKKKYQLENKEKIAKYRKKYYSENKDEINKQTVKRVNNRKTNDTLFKLKSNIRSLVASSIKLKGYRKNSKTSEILGCDFNEFKKYLESKFEPWMNWSNYGNWNGCTNELNVSWDIDHIIPFSVASTEEELMKLNHYSNLQPLCSYTNRHIKRDNVHN